MWDEKEYIDPFDKEIQYFWIKIEHYGRYLFACDEIRRRGEKKLCVADVGCANGYGSRLLSAVARTVVGYDINEDYLRIAQEKALSGQHFYCADFETPVKPPEMKFDFIASFEFLEHLSAPDHALRFMHESLCDDGTLICSVPNHLYEGRNEDGAPSNPFHKRIYRQEEILTIFGQYGFQTDAVYGQAFPNIFAKNEARLARKKRIPFTSSSSETFKDEAFLKYFSYMFAYPNNLLTEQTYSYIYVLRKSP